MHQKYHNHAPDENGYTHPRRTHRYFHLEANTHKITDTQPWQHDHGPADTVRDALKTHLTLVLLETCTPRQAEVLTLVYHEQKTHDETAAELSITRQAVSQHVAAGLARIQKALGRGVGTHIVAALGMQDDDDVSRVDRVPDQRTPLEG